MLKRHLIKRERKQATNTMIQKTHIAHKTIKAQLSDITFVANIIFYRNVILTLVIESSCVRMAS